MFKPIEIGRWIVKETMRLVELAEKEGNAIDEKLKAVAIQTAKEAMLEGVKEGKKIIAYFRDKAKEFGLELTETAIAHLEGLEAELSGAETAASTPAGQPQESAGSPAATEPAGTQGAQGAPAVQAVR